MLHDPRSKELFPRLTEIEVSRLLPRGRQVEFAPDAVIFKEGDLAAYFYVVLAGQVRVTKQVGSEETLLAIHEPGEFTGEISTIIGGASIATGRAIGPVRVLEIDPETFKHVLTDCSEGASVILSAMAGRAREVEDQLKQQEKLAALGRLSAGLAHELNNPAAAGRRAAQQLREMLATVQGRMLSLCEGLFPAAERRLLIEVQQAALDYLTCAPRLAALERSDREDALADWLDGQSVPEGWKFAPVLVSAGVDAQRLTVLADRFSPEAFSEGLNWLVETLTLTGLVDEVEKSTDRIAQLVKAIKSYTYMDQAPLQEIDIHDGLENTLTILHHKLKYGVTVHRDYAPDLPRILAYGSELNQVWTNLIDNAVFAMHGKGALTVRTSRLADSISVEIIDDGPGIPEDVRPRIFDPFFTTKGVGEGTGLGLDIARKIVVKRHGGEINVYSQPGQTRFAICLPIHRPDASRG